LSDEITVGLHEGMPNDIYHAQADWASSTMLKRLLPEEYKAGGSQEALDFGSLFHVVVLEPDMVETSYVALDAETVGVKADGSKADNPTMTKAWKLAVAEAESDGKKVIAASDLDRAHAMRDAIERHPAARELIYDGTGHYEQSAFWIDEHGVRHKARFDRRIPGALIDLKSTSAKPGLYSLTKTCIDYGYDLSAAHYLTVAEGLGLDVSAFIHVWVEKVEPYRVTVTELDELFIVRGRHLRERALERASKRAEPYEGATGRLTLICPEWALPYDDEMEIA
jgi:hypothetical protein